MIRFAQEYIQVLEYTRPVIGMLGNHNVMREI